MKLYSIKKQVFDICSTATSTCYFVLYTYHSTLSTLISKYFYEFLMKKFSFFIYSLIIPSLHL
nr:MAG TPA: hypothetical protein [Caudoviricetes sp.]